MAPLGPISLGRLRGTEKLADAHAAEHVDTPAKVPADAFEAGTVQLPPIPAPMSGRTETTVQVPEPAKFERVSKALFGHAVEAEEIAELFAPPPGSRVSVYASDRDNRLGVSVAHPYYESHLWWFGRNDAGRLEAELQGWDLEPWAPSPPNFGTRVFAEQVPRLAAAGFERMVTHAVGPPAQSRSQVACGHIAWPLMGFNAPLGDDLRAQLPPELADATCLNELLMMDGGIAWWKQHAVGGEMAFSLEPGSTSRKVLEARVASKGWIVDGGGAT